MQNIKVIAIITTAEKSGYINVKISVKKGSIFLFELKNRYYKPSTDYSIIVDETREYIEDTFSLLGVSVDINII